MRIGYLEVVDGDRQMILETIEDQPSKQQEEAGDERIYP